LVIIDVDQKAIIKELGLNIEKIIEKGHWVVRTGRGYHIYCKHNKNPGNIIKDDNLHIEFRGNGGYVVAPPSIHPNGSEYKFLYHKTPENMNTLLVEDVKHVFNDIVNKLQVKRGIKQDSKKKIFDLKKGVRIGERDNSAFKIACDYKKKGLSQEETYNLIKRWN